MDKPPRLTDPEALRRNRRRARADALFLHDLALDEAEDRLAMVNKTFKNIAIISPFPKLWRARFPDAICVPDTEVLDLTPGAHDLVIHGVCLHWADDPVGQLVQMRHALQPDGMALVVTLGGQTLHELRAALAQAETEVTGGLSPRVLPMADIRDLGALMQRAGLALPVADSAPLRTSYATPLHLMHELRAMGEANALDSRLRHPTRRSVLLRAAQIYAESFPAENGRVAATFEMITLAGWAPDASQPQPLRPGTATHRLAQALGTDETKLKD
ncbi:SAM-dependent methyltransferase [Sagittula sp. NFXS13]|uniref:SAM-dependent methyltransferase n=1 Tax=Sagittula sp. NFXS13 TaxID=2819095 RepID=UPI0032DEAC50